MEIFGATNSMYQIASATTDAVGNYSCVVTNACGTTTSSTAAITILPVVSVRATETSIFEGGIGGVWIEFIRARPTHELLRVRYAVSGTASDGGDFNALSGSADLPAGATLVPLFLAAIDDDEAEGSETVVVTLQADANYCVASSASSTTITIIDNDELRLLPSTNQLPVTEGRTNGFTVRLNGRSTNNITVTVTRTGGDTSLAVSGDNDHVFNTNNWNVPKPFTISASQDSDSTNGVATFTISGSGLSNVVLTAVEEDDDPPALGVLIPVVYGATNATGVVGVAFSYQPQVSLYSLTQNRTNWTAAEGAAITLGGHLVSINSSNEQAALERIFMTGLGDRTPYWIGFNDVAAEGTFVWSSGEPVFYTNWNSGEPNNNGNQDYGAMNLGRALDAGVKKGTWSDTFLDGYAGSGGIADGPYRGIMELPHAGRAHFVATNLPPALTLNSASGVVSGIPSSSGTRNLTLGVVTTNGGSGTHDVDVTILPYTYAYWLTTFSGPNLPAPNAQSPGDDPDGDGLVNAAEYAFNLPPMTPNPGARPRAALEHIFSNKYLLVTYRQHRWANDVNIIVQRASRLDGPWSQATMGLFDYRLLNADTEELTMIVIPSIVPDQNEFLRISVELSQP